MWKIWSPPNNRLSDVSSQDRRTRTFIILGPKPSAIAIRRYPVVAVLRIARRTRDYESREMLLLQTAPIMLP